MIIEWRVYQKLPTLDAPSVFLGTVKASTRDEAWEAALDAWPAKTLLLISAMEWDSLSAWARSIFEGTFVPKPPRLPSDLPEQRRTRCEECDCIIVYHKIDGRWRNPPRRCGKRECYTRTQWNVRMHRLKRAGALDVSSDKQYTDGIPTETNNGIEA